MGCVAGAIPGLFFYDKSWLGGYASWERRMVRLAHISFFGIGFLNLAFGLTCRFFDFTLEPIIPSYLLILGSVTMPLVCYLSAWRSHFRHIFFIPATSVTLATGLFVWRILVQ